MNKKNRPKIIINCAMSADGKIALPNKKQLRISSDEDIKRVHHLRDTCDAILVGVGAVLSDDPKLTVKNKFVEQVHQPLRIVLDSYCQTPTDALVVNNKANTLIFTDMNHNNVKKFNKNIEVISVNSTKNGLLDLHEIMNILYKKKVQSVLVEGGGTIIWNFIQSKLVDELSVYIGSMIIGGKQAPTMADGNGVESETDVIKLELKSIKKIGDGVLVQYQPKQ